MIHEELIKTLQEDRKILQDALREVYSMGHRLDRVSWRQWEPILNKVTNALRDTGAKFVEKEKSANGT